MECWGRNWLKMPETASREDSDVANSKSSPRAKRCLGVTRVRNHDKFWFHEQHCVTWRLHKDDDMATMEQTRIDIASAEKGNATERKRKKKKGRTENDGYSRAESVCRKWSGLFLILFWSRIPSVSFFNSFWSCRSWMFVRVRLYGNGGVLVISLLSCEMTSCQPVGTFTR